MSKHTDELLEAVQEIAEIIYMEMPLRYQDEWLSDIIVRGIWTPDDGMKYKDGAFVDDN
jgi:hypothetical protein